MRLFSTCAKLSENIFYPLIGKPKLTIKTPEPRHWRRSGISIVNFGVCIKGKK